MSKNKIIKWNRKLVNPVWTTLVIRLLESRWCSHPGDDVSVNTTGLWARLQVILQPLCCVSGEAAEGAAVLLSHRPHVASSDSSCRSVAFESDRISFMFVTFLLVMRVVTHRGREPSGASQTGVNQNSTFLLSESPGIVHWCRGERLERKWHHHSPQTSGSRWGRRLRSERWGWAGGRWSTEEDETDVRPETNNTTCVCVCVCVCGGGTAGSHLDCDDSWCQSRKSRIGW